MKLLQEFLFPLKRSQNIFDKHNKLSQTKKGKTLQSILVSWSFLKLIIRVIICEVKEIIKRFCYKNMLNFDIISHFMESIIFKDFCNTSNKHVRMFQERKTHESALQNYLLSK